MIKKAYIKPDMKVLLLLQRTSILAGSLDENKMNKKLQNEEEADEAW